MMKSKQRDNRVGIRQLRQQILMEKESERVMAGESELKENLDVTLCNML